MKFMLAAVPVENCQVAPVRERGLKCADLTYQQGLNRVAPVRERGLKFNAPPEPIELKNSRSREGAWIEIIIYIHPFLKPHMILRVF